MIKVYSVGGVKHVEFTFINGEHADIKYGPGTNSASCGDIAQTAEVRVSNPTTNNCRGFTGSFFSAEQIIKLLTKISSFDKNDLANPRRYTEEKPVVTAAPSVSDEESDEKEKNNR